MSWLTVLPESFLKRACSELAFSRLCPESCDSSEKSGGCAGDRRIRCDALDDPEASIPYAAMGRLLAVAAEQTQCPHFGLELGKKIDIASLGLVGQLMRNAPTLGAALLDLASHQHRNAHGSVVYLLLKKQQAFFGYAVYQPNVPGNNLICDGVALGGYHLVCELIDTRPTHAIEVLLSRSMPQDSAPYEQAFGVQVHYNAAQTAVVLPRTLLEHPILGADAHLRSVLQQRVLTLSHAGPLDTVTQLRRNPRRSDRPSGIRQRYTGTHGDESPDISSQARGLRS